MTEHPHGSRARYVHGKCRCGRCREANTRYHHTRKEWLKGRIEPPLEDADQARRHLMGLRTKGVGLRTIEEVTGICRTSLQKISIGQTRRIKRGNSLAILSLDVEDIDRLPPGLTIPAKSTWRRINALLEKGWTRTRLAEALGYVGGLQLDEGHVTVENARRVRDLFAEHCGLRCVICGKPLWHHSILNPCLGRRD